MVLRFAVVRVLLPTVLTFAAAGCLAPDAVPGEGGGGNGTTSETTGGGGAAPSLALGWARSYGLPTDEDQRALSLSVTSQDDVVFGGEFVGSLTMGALPTLQNTAGRDAFAAQLDPQGEPTSLAGL